jgi:chromosomal replication initiation ATPase DnaA
MSLPVPLVRPPAPAVSPDATRPPTIAITVALAAWDSEVEHAELAHVRRGEARVTDARHLAIYLAHVALGHDLTCLASAFGRDRATIRHALRRIEDRRDDPGFDRRVARLEAILVLLRPSSGRAVRA